MSKKKYTVLDLFCGCGGLSLGFEMAGFEVEMAIDNWEDALVTYRHNREGVKAINADLLNLDPKEIADQYGMSDVDVIIGGPPCQGFSVAGKRIIDDERNKLYKSFVRFVEFFQPRAFVMENVPNILSMGEGIIRDAIIKDFSDLGYIVSYKVLMASDYGVPQNRRRAIFVGLRDRAFSFPEKTIEEPVTTYDALSDLPEWSIEDGEEYPVVPMSDYQKMIREGAEKLYNHQASIHTPETQRIIAMVPDGGNYKCLPEEMWSLRKVHIAWTRMNSKRPCFTIDTGHRHHFHYKYNRVPTVREAARIQSFPDKFVFLGSRTSQNKQVGNAVPPYMAYAIAKQLLNIMNKKMSTYYDVPDQFWHRIHFVRPRFKSNIENVLLYMAKECCRIPELPCDEYNEKYFNAIKMFPGNIDMADKTLQNWRTEIPALFGFYTENKEEGYTKTSQMARFLYEQQDLPQFMKFFLYSFQFPGGHMKSQDLQDIIFHGIRFKPAKTIIQVLLAGNEILASKKSEKMMSISAEEATYCIFNDIRVTSGETSSKQIAQTILQNRKNGIKYYNPQDSKVFSSKGVARTKGDVTRYAGDILDYMEIANLLEERHGFFSLKGNERQSIMQFAKDETFFNGYEKFYKKKHLQNAELSKIEPEWFEYVNSSLRPDLFKSDLSNLLRQDEEIDVVFQDRIQQMVTSDDKTTKDIGNIGEAIICGHEKMRLKICGYEQFVKLVQIVDSPSYHPGFDIDSYEADGTENHRYIEVKTTISKKAIQMYGFRMSPNEWRVAGTIGYHYCVYRLMLSEQAKILYVLRDPVKLYKTDKIDAEPRDGMEITFDVNSFEPTKLLAWKK